MNEEAPSPFEISPERSKLFIKSLTPEQRRKFNELSKKGWWWRRRKIHREIACEVNWPVVEEAVRNYELMRRSPGGKQFTRTYLELGRDDRTLVHGLWVNWSQVPYRFVTNRVQFEEQGWTPIYQNEHRQWNLRLSYGDLIREFVREIKTLQKIQKIHPQHPLKGRKFRGVSWKLVEVLDCNQHGIGPLNKSERHTLSEAPRQAVKCFDEYTRFGSTQTESSDSLKYLTEKPDKYGLF